MDAIRTSSGNFKNSSLNGFVLTYNQFHQFYDRFKNLEVDSSSSTPPSSQRKRSARYELNVTMHSYVLKFNELS